MILLQRAFVIFLLESPLQTWDNMLALQTRSEEPEQQKHYVVHVFGWLVFGSVNLAAHSLGRDTGMIVLKTDQKGDSSCVLPPPSPLVILALEAFSMLANRNKALPLFVRQHMLWLKINSENILTVLDCC